MARGADGRRLGLRGWALMITANGLVGSVAALPVIAGAIQFVQRSDRARLYLRVDVRLRIARQIGSIVRGCRKRPLPIESRQRRLISGIAVAGIPSGSWLDNGLEEGDRLRLSICLAVMAGCTQAPVSRPPVVDASWRVKRR